MSDRQVKFHLSAIIVGLCLLVGAPDRLLADEVALWGRLKSGGHVALLRHALAPGTGDPADFTIGDCSTQRNLSEEGRAQAARIGERFRANGIDRASVFSSQWCRCLDTSELLGLGPVTELPTLNSFFRRSERQEPQTTGLKAWLSQQDLSGVVVLVTHQVNITALTGVYPSSGELVVARPSASGELSVIGTIATD
jgi:broad specificity phosphatase PhoE